ncbi:MAG: zinc ribbon domain-containing protein [Nitrospinaceae bacterium]|jgi:putative FmdB family regulatory protein|nr:zinc ribbon domain-containing protein [Nitrospinaceae bacterium]MDP6735218.1 zinc ribbon domain-containing protein [Nitrospinaceae bacterium]MDP7611643.1 zinc ribbon domain-containing protein [Nitrospinaceae bacterium]
MPFYDYQCEKCKETFEVLQKVSDEPLAQCEKCGGPMHKLINNMTFHLYGPGFYTTDNKKKYLK